MMKFVSASVVIILSGILWLSAGLNNSSQAAESNSQQYFLKELESEHVMLVSPNFDGDLSPQHLWQSLTEIGEAYDVKEAQLIYSTWPNVREVPRLLVYVEPKVDGVQSRDVIANSNPLTESNRKPVQNRFIKLHDRPSFELANVLK